MASLQFPLDYGMYGGPDDPNPNHSMIGFQSVKIQTSSSPGNIKVSATGDWVWLPVPPSGLETSYKQGWGEQTAGAGKAALSAVTSAIFGSNKGEAFANLKDAAMGAWKTDKSGVAQEMVQKFTGTGGISQALLEQAFVQYTGPGYRSHSFNFSLRPKTWQESAAIDNILMFFKKFAAPVQLGGSLTRLYEVPHIFEIAFVPDNGLFDIKASALESIDVKYGGEKYNTFSDTHKPVQTDITLSFKEMHLMTSQDFGGEEDRAETSAKPTFLRRPSGPGMSGVQ